MNNKITQCGDNNPSFIFVIRKVMRVGENLNCGYVDLKKANSFTELLNRYRREIVIICL